MTNQQCVAVHTKRRQYVRLTLLSPSTLPSPSWFIITTTDATFTTSKLQLINKFDFQNLIINGKIRVVAEDGSFTNCTVQCESKKNPPPLRLSEFFSFFHKRLRIFNQFFTHPLHVLMYARLQIFMQLSPILTKLCHIKRDNLVHIGLICTKCPKRTKTRAFRRLRKSLIALLIVVCRKSL